MSIVEALALKKKYEDDLKAQTETQGAQTAIDESKKQLQANAAYERNNQTLRNQGLSEQQIQARANSPMSESWTREARVDPIKYMREKGLYDRYAGSPTAKAYTANVESDITNEKLRKGGGELAEKARSGAYSGDQGQNELVADNINLRSNIGDTEGVLKAIDGYVKNETKPQGGGGMNGWMERSKDWDAISQMPDGEEKEKAKVAYLYKWSPSTGYSASPEGIKQAANKAVAVETATSPIKTQTAANTSAASTKAKLEAEKGNLVLSETASERLGDVQASMSQLGELVNGLKNPELPQGPISQIRRLNPYDWQAQTKQQLIASTKQLVGKALEGGVLRAEDEVKYNKILPTMADTYESASKKTEQLQSMLDNAYKAKLGSLKKAGYDVSNFSPSVNTPPKPQGTGTIAKVANTADYNKLPSGAQYYDPNGVLRRKK